MSDVKKWDCLGCGTTVTQNASGQVRDEQGRHHNKGEACIPVLRARIEVLEKLVTYGREVLRVFPDDPEPREMLAKYRSCVSEHERDAMFAAAIRSISLLHDVIRRQQSEFWERLKAQ